MPSFPGAYSQGKTKDEAYRNLLVAIKDLVETYATAARPSRRRRARAA
jgi:predicted RNase H-like HicB family nuclease